MGKRLAKKNAIITGARRGIGRSIVEAFAENGSNIWACARKEDSEFESEMMSLAGRCNVWIRPIYFDLSDADAVKKAFNIIRNEKKNVDILVNNAGIPFGGTMQMTPENKLRDVGIRVNAIAPGLTKTSMGDYKAEKETEKVLSRSSLHRIAQPAEIANVAVFLASDEASFITGQALVADGGRLWT